MNKENLYQRGDIVKGWSEASLPERKDLCGKYVRLEPLHLKHLDSLYTALRDSPDHDWYYMPIGPFVDKQDLKDWSYPMLSNNDPLFFVIINQDSDAILGFLSYLNINSASGSIEIGYIQFSPQLQRTSGATEAIWLLIKQAFELGYRRVEWKCNALNRRSRKAALRLGFTFEGIFRQAMVVKGRNRDTAWYSIIDKEWAELKGIFEHWLKISDCSQTYVPLSELMKNRKPLKN